MKKIFRRRSASAQPALSSTADNNKDDVIAKESVQESPQIEEEVFSGSTENLSPAVSKNGSLRSTKFSLAIKKPRSPYKVKSSPLVEASEKHYSNAVEENLSPETQGPDDIDASDNASGDSSSPKKKKGLVKMASFLKRKPKSRSPTQEFDQKVDKTQDNQLDPESENHFSAEDSRLKLDIPRELDPKSFESPSSSSVNQYASNDLLNENYSLQAENVRLTAKLMDMEFEYENLHEELKSQRNALKDSETETSRLLQEREILSAENKDLSKRLAIAQASIPVQNDQPGTQQPLDVSSSRNNSTGAGRSSNVDAVKKELLATKWERDNLLKLKEELDAENKTIRQALQQAQTKHSRETQELRKTIASLEDIKAELSAEIQELHAQGSLNQINGEVLDIKISSRRSSNAIHDTSLQAKLDSLERQNLEYSQAMLNIQDAILSFKERGIGHSHEELKSSSELLGEIGLFISQCNAMEKQLEILRPALAERDELKETCQQLQQQVDNLEAGLLEKSNLLQAAQVQLETALFAQQQAEDSSSNLSNTVTVQDNTISSMREELGALRNKAKEMAELESRLRDEVQEKISLITSVKDENVKRETSLKQLEAEYALALAAQKQAEEKAEDLLKLVNEKGLTIRAMMDELEAAKVSQSQMDLIQSRLQDELQTKSSLVAVVSQEMDQLQQSSQKVFLEKDAIIEKLHAEIDSLVTSNSELRTALQEVKTLLEQHNQSLVLKDSQIESTNALNQQLKDEIEASSLEIANLSEALQHDKEQIASLKCNVNELIQSMQQDKIDIQTAVSEKESLSKTLSEMDRLLDSKSQEIKSLQSEITALRNDGSLATQSLQNELDRVQQTVSDITRQLLSSQTKERDTESAVSELENSLKALMEKLSSEQKLSQNLQLELSKEREALLVETSKVKEAIKTRNSVVNQLETTIEQLTKESEKEKILYAELEEAKKDLEVQVEQLKSNYQQAIISLGQQQNDAIEKQNDFVSQLEIMSNELSGLQAKYEQQSLQLADSQLLVSKLESDLNALTLKGDQDIQKHILAIETLKNELADVKKERDILSSDVSALNQELGAELHKSHALNSTVSQLEASMAQLKEDIGVVRDHNAFLAATAEEQKSRTSVVQQAKNEVQKDYETLKEQLAVSHQANDRLQEKLNVTESALDAAQIQMQEQQVTLLARDDIILDLEKRILAMKNDLATLEQELKVQIEAVAYLEATRAEERNGDLVASGVIDRQKQTIEALEINIKSLEQNLKSVTELLELEKTHRASVESDNNRMNSVLQCQEQTISGMEQKLAGLESMITHERNQALKISEDLNCHLQIIKELNGAILSYQAQIFSLEQANEKGQKDHESANKLISQLQGTINQQTERIVYLEQQEVDLLNDIQAKEIGLKQVQLEYQDAQKCIQELQISISESQITTQLLTGKVEELNRQLSNESQKIDQIQHKSTSDLIYHENQIIQTKVELDAALSALQGRDQVIAKLQNDIMETRLMGEKEREKLLCACKEREQSLIEQITALTHTLDTTKTLLDEETLKSQSLTSQLSQSQTVALKLQESIAVQMAEDETRRDQTERLQSDIEKLSSIIQEKEAILTALGSSVEEYAVKLARMEEEKKTLQMDMQTALEREDALVQEASQLRIREQELLVEIDTFSSDLSKGRLEVKDSINTAAEVDSHAQIRHEEIQGLEKRLAEAQDQIQELTEQLRHTTARLSGAQDRIVGLEQAHHHYTDKCSKAEEEIESLQVEIKALKSDIQTKTISLEETQAALEQEGIRRTATAERLSEMEKTIQSLSTKPHALTVETSRLDNHSTTEKGIVLTPAVDSVTTAVVKTPILTETSTIETVPLPQWVLQAENIPTFGSLKADIAEIARSSTSESKTISIVKGQFHYLHLLYFILTISLSIIFLPMCVLINVNADLSTSWKLSFQMFALILACVYLARHLVSSR